MGLFSKITKALTKAVGLDKIAEGLSKAFKVFNPKSLFDGLRGLSDKAKDKAGDSLDDIKKSGHLQNGFKALAKVAFPRADRLLDEATVSTVKEFAGRATGTNELAGMAKTLGGTMRSYIDNGSVSDQEKANVVRNAGQIFAKSQADIYMQQA